MKHFIILLLIFLTTTGVNAQDHSFFTIGAGYPIFWGIKSDDPHYDYSIRANYNLFVEKEVMLFKKVPEIRLTPGLAFTQINESYKYDGLGGGGEGEYKHKALSGYVKLLYKIDRQPEIVTDYYFGLQIGYYLQSRTTASESSWQLNSNGIYDYYSTKIDNGGADFFHSNYVGIIAGIQPLGDKETCIQPKIELAFYPSFATVNSYYANGETKKNMFQISVSIGFGNKNKNRLE